MAGSDAFDKLLKQIATTRAAIPSMMNELAAREGQFIVGMAKERTAVVTGTLRGAYKSYTSPLLNTAKSATVWITNNTEYAAFYEKGHRLVNKDGKTVGWVQGRFALRISVKIYKDTLMEKRTERFFDKKLRQKKYLGEYFD